MTPGYPEKPRKRPAKGQPLQGVGDNPHQRAFPSLSVPEIAWTEIGLPFTSTPAARAAVGDAIAGLTWVPMAERRSKPMMIALGLKTAIEQLRIPAVAYAYDHALAPYGLLAIEGRYRNGTARIYLLDCGDETVVIRTDFTPNQGAPGCSVPNPSRAASPASG